jgi:hypothetical protein
MLEISGPCSVNSVLLMVLGGFCKVISYCGSLGVLSAVETAFKVFASLQRRVQKGHIPTHKYFLVKF